MSLIPRTPFATYIPNMERFSHRWTCMSHNPGIRYFPEPLIACATDGRATDGFDDRPGDDHVQAFADSSAVDINDVHITNTD